MYLPGGAPNKYWSTCSAAYSSKGCWRVMQVNTAEFCFPICKSETVPWGFFFLQKRSLNEPRYTIQNATHSVRYSKMLILAGLFKHETRARRMKWVHFPPSFWKGTLNERDGKKSEEWCSSDFLPLVSPNGDDDDEFVAFLWLAKWFCYCKVFHLIRANFLFSLDRKTRSECAQVAFSLGGE